MNCEEMRRTLGLEDLDLRPESAAITNHLRQCEACRGRFPEIASLYGLEASEPVLVSTRWWRGRILRVAAVAALLLGGLGLGLAFWRPATPLDPPKSHERQETPVDAGILLRAGDERALMVSTFEEETTTVSRVEKGRVVQMTRSHGRILRGRDPNRSYSE